MSREGRRQMLALSIITLESPPPTERRREEKAGRETLAEITARQSWERGTNDTRATIQADYG